MPNSFGAEGPNRSASSSPTFKPSLARPTARLQATVDLPTPPLPEATATMCLTPGSGVVERVRGWGGAPWRARRRPRAPLRGQRHDRAVDAGNRLDGGFGPCAHRFQLAALGGIDGDRGEHLAVAQGDAGNCVGLGERRLSVGSGTADRAFMTSSRVAIAFLLQIGLRELRRVAVARKRKKRSALRFLQ